VVALVRIEEHAAAGEHDRQLQGVLDRDQEVAQAVPQMDLLLDHGGREAPVP